jgi:ribose 5-phosphate isomerase A
MSKARALAAAEALKSIKNGMRVGLGSGSTMAEVVAQLSKLTKEKSISLEVVPSSYQIAHMASSLGLRLRSLSEIDRVDIAIDGADQIERSTLNLIKGGGGALTCEKIIDSVAGTLIIVADEGKITNRLGVGKAVPIEVLPSSWRIVTSMIRMMGGRPVLREGEVKVGPVITDNGNFILDVDFGWIKKPKLIDRSLKLLPGVVETGLFIGMTDMAYIGKRDGKVELLKA